MSDYLVLQWGRSGVLGLAAEVHGGTVRLGKSFAADWPADIDPARDPQGVGAWLKLQLQTLGRGHDRLIVLVSREDVVLRLLGLPAAGDETLPDLVRYQTGTRSSVPLDQLALDYVPLAVPPPQGGRWVQTATVPTRILQQIKSSVTAAGLELSAVGITTIAVGELIAQAQRANRLPADQQHLVIRMGGEQVEVALWHGTDLLFAHVARASDSQSAVVEVQRAVMSHHGTVGGGTIGRAWLLAPGEDTTDLTSALTTQLECEVTRFDPARDLPQKIQAIEKLDDAASFVAPLGALVATAAAMVPAIDFLNPRQRAVKPDRTKLIAVAAVAGLVLLLPAIYLASRMQLKSLEARIAAKEKIVRQQDESLAAGKPMREIAAFLSAWDDQRVNWLEPMGQITAEMPGTDRVYLDRWRFDVVPGAARQTTEATGFARQRQDAERLTQRLAEEAGLRIQPNPIAAGGNDPEYPIFYQLDAELLPPQRRRARNTSE